MSTNPIEELIQLNNDIANINNLVINNLSIIMTNK